MHCPARLCIRRRFMTGLVIATVAYGVLPGLLPTPYSTMEAATGQVATGQVATGQAATGHRVTILHPESQSHRVTVLRPMVQQAHHLHQRFAAAAASLTAVPITTLTPGVESTAIITPTPSVVATALTPTPTVTPTSEATTISTPTALLAQPSFDQDQTATTHTNVVIKAQVQLRDKQGGTSAQTLTLIVPGNAVAMTTTVGVSSVPPSQVPLASGTTNDLGIGAAFDLQAQISETIEITTFRNPLVLQISYDPKMLAGINAGSLTIAYYNTHLITPTWVSVPTTVDPVAHLLTTSVAHFTLFQIRATARTSAQRQAVLSHAPTSIATAHAIGLVLTTGATGHNPALPAAPVLVTLPHGRVIAGSAEALRVLGPPHMPIMITFSWTGSTLIHHIVIDGHGYAVVSAPDLLRHAPGAQKVRVDVVAISGKTATHFEGLFTLVSHH